MGWLWGCLLFSLICLSFWNWGYILGFFHSIWSSTIILPVQSCKQTHSLLAFFLFFPFCFLLCSLFAKSSHVPPKLSFLTHSPTRGQFSVARLFRCQLQHSHQWYVSTKLSALRLSSANEWTPVHSAVVTYDGHVHIQMSLSLSTQCMKMCVPL